MPSGDIKVLSLSTFYPTQLDVAETAGEGNIGTEANVSNLHQFGFPKNHVIPNRDGNGIAESDAGLLVTFDSVLTINISGGECWIDGYRLIFSGALVQTGGAKFTVTDEKHNYIFIRLEKDGNGHVEKAVLEMSAVDAGSQPTWFTESILIAKVVATGGSISEVHDFRPSAFSWPIFMDFTEFNSGSGSSFVGTKEYWIYVPHFGKFTTLQVPVNIGQVGGFPVAGTADMRLTIQGPNGAVQNGAAVTSDPLVAGDYSEILTPSINIDNTIGRFTDVGATATFDTGGFLKLIPQMKPSASSVQPFFTSFASTLGGSPKDLRGQSRFKEWDAPF